MEAFIGGAWRAPGRGEVLVAGSWRRVTRGEVYRGGVWRKLFTFISPLSVSAYDVDGFASFYKPTVVSSYQATATPAGGLGPYSYAWQTLSGGASADSPTNATTSFSRVLGPGQADQSTARVTVTDALGATATAQINITLTNDGGF